MQFLCGDFFVITFAKYNMESAVEIETTYKKTTSLGLLLSVFLIIRIVRLDLPISWEHIVYLIPLSLIAFETVKKKLYKVVFYDKSITIIYKVFFVSISKQYLFEEIEMSIKDLASAWQGKRKILIITKGEQIIEKISLITFKADERDNIAFEIAKHKK